MKLNDDIVIVSGLPRSGTSMMMKMLDAGGVPLVVDNIRQADEDNPKGYFELEAVKQLAKDTAWIEASKGKGVKVISQLLYDLPTANDKGERFNYRVLFMRRHMDEILASQREMLLRSGKTPPTAAEDEEVRQLSIKHLNDTIDWLAQNANMKVLYVNYGRMVKDPATCVGQVNDFLGGELNVDAMKKAMDPSLYRNRKS